MLFSALPMARARSVPRWWCAALIEAGVDGGVLVRAVEVEEEIADGVGVGTFRERPAVPASASASAFCVTMPPGCGSLLRQRAQRSVGDAPPLPEDAHGCRYDALRR